MIEPEQRQKQLVDWYQTVAGQNLLRYESAMISNGLKGIFGYHLMILGPLDYGRSVAGSPISHKIVMNNEHLQHGLLHILGSQYALPLQSDSIDVVVLPHLLEYSHHPRHVLHEVKRITRPDGYIVILGFNPISCYRVYRVLLRFKQHPPWQGYYYHPVRLRDWVHSLGFRVIGTQYCGFIPPIAHQSTQRYFAFMERAAKSFIAPLGGVYMIVARNQTIVSNVVRPVWKRKRTKLDNGIIEPTTRMRDKS